MTYLLFGARSRGEGGASDFISAHNTITDAMGDGIEHDIAVHPRLSSWMHIAHLDGGKLNIVATLNIPDTEYDETGELEWLEVE